MVGFYCYLTCLIVSCAQILLWTSCESLARTLRIVYVCVCVCVRVSRYEVFAQNANKFQDEVTKTLVGVVVLTR